MRSHLRVGILLVDVVDVPLCWRIFALVFLLSRALVRRLALPAYRCSSSAVRLAFFSFYQTRPCTHVVELTSLCFVLVSRTRPCARAPVPTVLLLLFFFSLSREWTGHFRRYLGVAPVPLQCRLHHPPLCCLYTSFWFSFPAPNGAPLLYFFGTCTLPP